MMVLFFLVLLVYAVTVAQLIFGYAKVPASAPVSAKPMTFFSIVVPFRNEAENLPALLESLKNLDYPSELFEFIFVDDFSSDKSQRIVYDWRMQNGTFAFTLLENIKVSGSPKKDAIARAVPIAKGDWILTTDADCTVPQTWLKTYNDHILATQAQMLAGPVSLHKPTGFRQNFEQLDVLSLQGTTIGSFGMGLGFMCNGANFGYAKKFFQELGGFSGLTSYAGGDDVLLLQKAMAKAPEKVAYLKSRDALVETQPCRSFGALFGQRVRWAAKTGGYQSLFAKDLAVIVFLGNLALVAAAVWTIGNPCCWMYLAVLFAVKFGVDTALLLRADKFFKSGSLVWMLPAAVLYPAWCVCVALASLFGFRWKKRSFRR